MEGEADNGRIGPRQRADEKRGPALDRIAARLAAPLAGREVKCDFLFRQTLEGDARFAHAFARAVRRDEMHRRPDAMRAAGEQLEAGARFRFGFGFRQDAAAAGDDSVRAEHEGICMIRRNGFCLSARETKREAAGKFGLLRGFIDFRRDDAVRFDADLLEKREPARRGAGENEAGFRARYPPRRVPRTGSCSGPR